MLVGAHTLGKTRLRAEKIPPTDLPTNLNQPQSFAGKGFYIAEPEGRHASHEHDPEMPH